MMINVLKEITENLNSIESDPKNDGENRF